MGGSTTTLVFLRINDNEKHANGGRMTFVDQQNLRKKLPFRSYRSDMASVNTYTREDRVFGLIHEIVSTIERRKTSANSVEISSKLFVLKKCIF